MSTDSERALIDFVLKLLTIPKAPANEAIEQVLAQYPEFQKLYDQVSAIREVSYSLCKGNLENHITERGFILSNLKALQANLRHLTWQSQKIADGDYSQTVDFLGEFSDAFNSMTAKLKVATTQLKDIARLDNLTKIPNRLSFEEYVEDAFMVAKNENKTMFVFIFDIDYFKKVNDTYGHAAGDQVLIQFAQIVSTHFRSTDIFARIGGEEFVAVIPDIQLETAVRIGERGRQSIESADFIIGDGFSLRATVSIGISCINNEDQTYLDIIKRADTALYDAKNGGRNAVKVLL